MADLEKLRMYIGGEWCDAASGETFESFNPFTGKPWALVPRGGAEDAERAVAAARKAFLEGEWPKLNPTQRGHRGARAAAVAMAWPRPSSSSPGLR